jgi:hypothetical protein
MKSSYLLAARNGDWKTMRSYLDIDENVKYSVDETSKKTAAVLAIENNHIDLLRAMLDREVALFYVTAHWFDQMDSIELLGDFAASLGNIDAIEALATVNHEIFESWNLCDILLVAARHNQRDLIQWLIDFDHIVPGKDLLLTTIDSGHLPLAKWMMSTGRAGIEEFTAVMHAASLEKWKIFPDLLEVCDPDFASVDSSGNTFWDIIDWRALVTIHVDNVNVLAFMAALRQKVPVFPENVTRLMSYANTYTSDNYLRAASEGDWSHMSVCLDEYFPLFKSVDSDRKSAAILIIDSGVDLSLLTCLDIRGALFHPDLYPGASRKSTLNKLCTYAAATMRLDSLRLLIDMGDDDLLENLVLHIARFGGLEIMIWLAKNYKETIVHRIFPDWGGIVLAHAITGDQLDIIELLMDFYQLTTYERSPLYYALFYGDQTFSTARWFLSTRRPSDIDIQTELNRTIKNTEWMEATILIDYGKANIDEDSLWQNVNWLKLAKNTSKDAKLFLRALLPRIDFPFHVYEVLMNTSLLRRRDGKEIFVHRLMVREGIIVRERVKTLHESRTRVVKQLDIPDDVKKYYLLDSFLSDKQMDMTTEKMWTSIFE